MDHSGAVTPKRRRVTRPCDFCHKRGLKCKPVESPGNSRLPGCQTCLEHREECTQLRKLGKRGKKLTSTLDRRKGLASDALLVEVESNRTFVEDEWATKTKGGSLGPKAEMDVLIDVYFDSIFPM